MYWIALTLFVVAVLSPQIVTYGWWGFDRDQTLSLFLLGVTGVLFLFFLRRDRDWRYQLRHRRIIRRESTEAAQDLNRSYIYIGEVNRKIELLERSAAVSLSENRNKDRRRRLKEFLEILQTLTGSKNCGIMIIDVAGETVSDSIGRTPEASPENIKRMLSARAMRICLDDWEVFTAVSAAGVRAFVFLPVGKSDPEDDPLLRIVAANVLNLYL